MSMKFAQKKYRKPRKVTEKEKELIVKMYLEGRTIWEIAQKLDRKPSVVYRVLKKCGLK